MFSIVIPTYKRDEDLAECLESIKKNTTLPYEVIVLHAGMQSTEKVCEKYGVNSVPDNARKNGVKVIPTCSYAAKVMRNDSYADLL